MILDRLASRFLPATTVRRFTATLLAAATAAGPLQAAYTASDADTIFNSYNNAFYVSNGGNAYYKENTDGGRAWFWGQANMIEMVADTYERTGDGGQRNMLIALCNGFMDYHGQDWSWNEYNDDVLWACIVFAKAWRITGHTTFRDRAIGNFDMVWNRGWSDHLGGGMFWRTDNQSKNACDNCPAAIVACQLYEITGDAAYLQKAKMLLAWTKRNLVREDGIVYDHMDLSGRVTTWVFSYNQGTWIGANNYVYKLTGERQYWQDALTATRATRDQVGDANGILPDYGGGDGSGFNGVGIRWIARFIEDQKLWEEFYPWMKANADAAWNVRRGGDNLSWNNWKAATATGTRYGFECFGSVTALQVVPASAGLATGDGDADWMPDSWETSYTGAAGLTALGPGGDLDGDGLPDSMEYAEGTNPTRPDTDDDGFPDGMEVTAGTNPLSTGSIPAGSIEPVLAHRWSFDTDATDATGGVTLTLNGGASISDGHLDLPGSAAPRTANASAGGAALAALETTFKSSSAISIEAWFTQDEARNWAKLFMAGQPSGDVYLDLTPRRGADGNVSSASLNTGAIESNVRGAKDNVPLPDGVPWYLAAVWDSEADTMMLHTGPAGGPLQTFTAGMGGKKPADLGFAQFFLGSAVQYDDPDFDGKIDEFRIWNGVLRAGAATRNAEAGPGSPSLAPGNAGQAIDPATGTLTLQFSGLEPGTIYLLESSTNLTLFTPVSASAFTATGTTASLSVPADLHLAPAAFFRLVKVTSA